MHQLKVGEIVKIKKEYQDKGDDTIKFLLVECSEDCDRVTIEALLGMSINPTYRVTLDMLEF